MRSVGIGLIVAFGVAVLSVPPLAAQGSGKAKVFSGVKLVDMRARTPEQTVTVSLLDDAMKIIDPAGKQEISSLPYSGLTVTHTLAAAPPASAGDPSAAATQPVAPPMYLGKTPRNWLTIQSGDETLTLRVSSKVYGQLKAALAARNVQVQEAQ